MCEHELKQALLDIEFLQECNNSANLALSVTRKELAAANARIAELEATLNETYTDDFGTVWTRPTAWAYAAVCNANDKNRESKEQAEAQCDLLKQENSKLAAAAIEQPPYKQDLIDRMKRMEDALREISNVTSNCLSHEEMKDKMKNIAKAALEEKL